MKPSRVLIGAAFALAFVVSPTKLSGEIAEAPLRRAAPDFTLHDARSVPIKLSDQTGKVVLLDFWATWCTGCKVEIPWYMEFANEYKSQGLAVIGVAMDEEGWAKVRPYLDQHPINYPIVVGDPDLAKRFGVTGLPVTLLIDRKGRVAATHVGLVKRGDFERELRKLLKEKARK